MICSSSIATTYSPTHTRFATKMEDPVNEIRGVVKGLVAARNASEQKYCMQRYFAPDASFDHVLCTVSSGPNSRDNGVLPIYQWLRVISRSDIEVYSVGEF